MALKDGESELDSVKILLLDTGKEISKFESFSLDSNYTTPCDHLRFVISDEDTELVEQYIVAGAKIQALVNDKPQFTGNIDKKSIRSSRGGSGTSITVEARDILGSVIDSNANPKVRINGDMTLLDMLAGVLVPFGITKIYNDGTLNRSLQSGAVAKPSASATAISVQIPKEELQADGTVKEAFDTVKATSAASAGKKQLERLKPKETKPKPEEGAYQYIDRMLKRFGLRMYAAADGSGVIVDSPDFDSATVASIKHSRADSINDVTSGDLTLNWEAMPSCVIVTGVSSVDAALDRTSKTVVAINELVGTDSSGQPLPAIKAVIAQHPGAIVLPIRSELTRKRKSFAENLVARPMYIKDKDSSTLDQMKAHAKRLLAGKMKSGFQLHYELEGLSKEGKVWCTNSMVDVDDQVLGVSEPLWVLEKRLEKSRSGTKTSITLILPRSLDLSADD